MLNLLIDFILLNIFLNSDEFTLIDFILLN